MTPGRGRKGRTSAKDEILRLAKARAGGPSSVFDLCFPAQLNLINDPCRFKTACCARRAGKTYATVLYIIITALQNPGCDILYLAKSREQAKGIVMKQAFERLNRDLGLGIEFKYSSLEAHFPNGSSVYINGADTSENRHDMFPGKFYKLVIIDEASLWDTDMMNFVTNKLVPMLTDVLGTMVLIGSPDDKRNFFYEVCTEKRDDQTKELLHPGWSNHTWKPTDNPFIAGNWKKALQDEIVKNPRFTDTVAYKQQWLGQWVEHNDSLVYPYDVERNWVPTLPGRKDDYWWVLAMDVGWVDPFAFVLMGFRKSGPDQNLYVVHAFEKPGMLTDEAGAYIDGLRKQYEITNYVIDPANANVRHDLTARFGLPLEIAEKHEIKKTQVRIMADDMTLGRIKLVGDGAATLERQWKKILWDYSDPRKPRPKDGDDHCADAALYGWRKWGFYVKRPDVSVDQPKDTRDEGDKFWDEVMREMEEGSDPLVQNKRAFGVR